MLRKALRELRTGLRAILGAPGKRRAHRETVENLPPLRTGLPEFGDHPATGQGRPPVLAFSPTWRSGSTLLQRLVMSGGDVWMWGEVYTRFEPLQQLADMFVPLTDDFPDEGHYTSEESTAEDLTGDWIARLSPRPRYLVRAHRAFWDELCAEPARERGYGRWGLKAVNVSGDYPAYLRRLYPDARVVFLVRNPYRAWLSYRKFQNWYASFPDDPVFTVQRFARLWSDNIRSFREVADDLDALLIRFEDLVEGGRTVRRLSEHLGTELDASVLERKVTGTTGETPDRTTLLERAVLRRIVGRQAERFGYEAV